METKETKDIEKIVYDMRRLKEFWDNDSPQILRNAANFYVTKLIDEYIYFL